jgi:hypothetical protein
MKWHPSSLGKLMTESRTKSEVLSQTTKSYIANKAKEDFFGYNSFVSTKAMQKGTDFEHESIELVNQVRDTFYIKNEDTIENDYLIGTPDIILDNSIIDIKTSWSLETFPAIATEGINKDYEWQLRGYMMLCDKASAELIYCMIDTDDFLLSDWDNKTLHKVSHIDPKKRITVLGYERNTSTEEAIRERLTACTEYYNEYIEQLKSK